MGEQQVIKSKCGYRVLPLSYSQVYDISFGACICDSCNEKLSLDGGNLIFVLNQVYCKPCYDEWNQRAKFYCQDIVFEEMIMKRYGYKR